MWPELVPGKRYLGARFLKPRVGDYLVFRNPANPKETFVKKIKNIRGAAYETVGTVPWASSSGDFGPVPEALVIGKIIFPSLVRR